MFSLVIKIAILVIKAALHDVTIATDGLVIDNVKLVIVEPPSFKISETINNTSFSFKLLYFFLKYSLSFLDDFKIIS